MFWYWRRILLINMMVLAFSCKNTKDHSDQEIVIPDDFVSFYDRFHKDSLFQIDHIIFPLAGVPAYDSLRSNDWTWKLEDWTMHRPFDDKGGVFKRNWYNVNSVIIEKIVDSSGRFSMERRWVKMGQEWTMIYYKEMGF